MSKRYVHKTKARYWPVINHGLQQGWQDEVSFVVDGSEMIMRWYDLGGKTWTARLEIYVESFHALFASSDLQEAFARVDNISPDAFCQLLERLGFADKTPYTLERD